MKEAPSKQARGSTVRPGASLTAIALGAGQFRICAATVLDDLEGDPTQIALTPHHWGSEANRVALSA